MKTFVIAAALVPAAALAMLPGAALAAKHAQQRISPQVSKTVPAAPARVHVNPCALYGAGFVQVEGSTACVKVGGSVRVDTRIHH